MRHLKKRNPSVITSGIFHNVDPHESFPLSRTLTRKLLTSTDLPVLLSSQTTTEAARLKPDNQALTLFHPVYERPDPDANRSEIRRRYGVGDNELMYLFYGLVRPYKGLDLLIDALNQLDLRENNIKVVVAGEFYTRKEPLLSQISEKTRPNIHLEDRFIGNREADELLFASDVMLLPYRSASQSGILADAINFRLPVICSDQPGFTDVITHQKHGWIFPSEDTEALKQAITTLTDDRLRAEFFRNLSDLKEELSWDRFTQNLFHQLEQRYKKHKSTY